MSCNDCCPPVILGGTGQPGPQGPEGPTGPPGPGVCVSTDPGNALQVGTDGCMYVAESAAGAEGPPGPQGPAGPPGPGACVSADPGNVLQEGTDGCLYVAEPSASQLLTGCGVQGDGSEAAPLAVATSGQWGTGPLAFPCDETNGQPVYCDAAGQVRTVPARFSRGWSASEGRSEGGPPDPTGTQRLIFDVTLEITNPSSCRDMLATTRLNVNGLVMTMTGGNEWAFGWGINYSNDGSTPPQPGPSQVLLSRRVPTDQASADSVKWPVIDSPVGGGSFGYVGAGQTVTARAALWIDFLATNPNPGADGVPPVWGANWFELYAEGHSL